MTNIVIVFTIANTVAIIISLVVAIGKYRYDNGYSKYNSKHKDILS